MDFGLIVSRTFNVNLITSVVTDPDIWETATEDGHEPDSYFPDVNSNCFIAAVEDKEVIGVFELRALNKVLLDVHPYILPEFRGKKALEAGRKLLEWVYFNAPQYAKLTGTVPTIYKNVKIYCNMLGFKEEGFNKSSFLKNGQILDQWYLGITREEIEGRIKWAA